MSLESITIAESLQRTHFVRQQVQKHCKVLVAMFPKCCSVKMCNGESFIF